MACLQVASRPRAPLLQTAFPVFSQVSCQKRASQGAASGKHGILLCYEIFHFIRAAVQGMCHLRHVTELFSYHADIQRKNFQEMQVLHFLLQKMSQQGAIVFQKGVHFRQESGGRKRAACSGEDGVHLSTMNKKIFYHVSVDAGAGERQGRPRTVLQLPATCGQLSGKGRPCAASRLRIFGEMDLPEALSVACAWGPVQGNRKGRAGRPCLPVCLRGTAQCSRMT